MTPQRIAWGTAGVVALATPVVVYFEGFRLEAYRDPVNIVTDCVGHTKTATPGTTNTVAQCAAKLREDMRVHWEGIRACTPGVTSLSDEEWAAYLSFSYNVGVGAFCRSHLAELVRAGSRAAACAELSRWVYAGGQMMPGLIKRRAAERELCEMGLPTRLPKGTVLG